MVHFQHLTDPWQRHCILTRSKTAVLYPKAMVTKKNCAFDNTLFITQGWSILGALGISSSILYMVTIHQGLVQTDTTKQCYWKICQVFLCGKKDRLIQNKILEILQTQLWPYRNISSIWLRKLLSLSENIDCKSWAGAACWSCVYTMDHSTNVYEWLL